jgi:hypothetical protein
MDTIMERPRKKPGRKPGRTHTEQLKVMLTPNEMGVFIDKAADAGLSYSDAMRAAIAAWKPKPREQRG